eukprot:CAMPEP_0182921816 /NCGR_PEP_ID=MMETSP0105_2-20130417/4386_1 /TAXON_ID=81532 ORGANISM="Acanthoeca-like sp., Strain 10tr" /NCGR_SAMPLE_ID=MMETSP0105_2 /ASSEMBLY_ACC=CAM_ASM_000205 /LENGTH=326 /DNA_ID=CAMNT_0025059371 /DNA_START=102 /DNA_END=1082 /DNA_ORIENTATION=-
MRAAASAYSNVTIGLLSTLVVLSLLGQISSVYYFLALTPGNVIPPLVHIQTLLTAGFLETNWILLAINAVALTFTGGVLEPLWGMMKYLEFVVVVNFFGCLLLAIIYIIGYIVTRDVRILFVQCHGFTCALAGFTVAYKQTNPQKKLSVSNFGVSIDARLAPALFTLATIVVYLGGLVGSHVPLMAMSGTFVSWVFLRFFQTKEDVRGDPSDNFTFADLFPQNLQPTVSVVGGRVYSVADSLKLVPKHSRHFDMSQPPAPPQSMTSSDSERRKKAAARDLEMRMGTAAAPAAEDTKVAVPASPPAQDGQHEEGGAAAEASVAESTA